MDSETQKHPRKICVNACVHVSRMSMHACEYLWVCDSRNGYDTSSHSHHKHDQHIYRYVQCTWTSNALHSAASWSQGHNTCTTTVLIIACAVLVTTLMNQWTAWRLNPEHNEIYIHLYHILHAVRTMVIHLSPLHTWQMYSRCSFTCTVYTYIINFVQKHTQYYKILIYVQREIV